MPDADLDLVSASLRADAADADAFFSVLAGKLAGTLPGQVETERAGLFGRGDVRTVRVSLGDRIFEAERDKRRIDCRARTVVRGIAVKSEDLTLDAWIDALSAALVAEADSSQRARTALQDLLAP